MTQSNKLIAAKRVAIAVAAVCASLSAPVHATDSKALLDLMLKKGVITQKDYDEFLEATKEQAENKAFREQRIDQDVSKAVKFLQKNAPNGFVRPNGAGLETADGNFTMNLTGRVHFDTRMINNSFGNFDDRDSASAANNFEVRRARIGASGTIFKDIGYEVVTNAVGSNANLIDTAFITYGFHKPAQVRIGRFKQPFSLEELTSSNNIDFMERSYINQLIPGKKLGVMLFGEPVQDMTYALSTYQNDFGQATNNAGREVAGRLTYNFAPTFRLSDSIAHFGVAGTNGTSQIIPTSSGNTRSNASADTRATFIGFRDENRGLSNIYRAQIGGRALNTPAYGGVSDEAANIDKSMGGLEAVYASGPFKLQSEYAIAKYNATTSVASGTGTVTASYVEVVYNLTGEKWSDAYRTGAFSSLRPAKNYSFDNGGGLWQVGLRYSSYDASGVTVSGTNAREQNSDKGNTATLGVNWFLNPNSRIMLNYSMTTFGSNVTPLDVTGATAGKKEQIISLRTQINF